MMKSNRDYYEILGLGRNASRQDVKKRFRQLALRYHPDRNPEDPVSEEMFKLVAEAYYVLSDQHRRRVYDREGPEGLRDRGYQGFERSEDVLKTFAAEFFEFLGITGVRPQRSPMRGADLSYQLELSPEEAATGIRKTIQISTMETCPKCKGNGVQSTSTVQTCPWCQGSGSYSEASTIFTAMGACPKCNGKGSGRLISCGSCNGQGRREVEKDLLVDIPAGVRDKTRLKISDEGDGGEESSESGDLYLTLVVRKRRE
jgi:molecular chaperone DnaJ